MAKSSSLHFWMKFALQQQHSSTSLLVAYVLGELRQAGLPVRASAGFLVHAAHMWHTAHKVSMMNTKASVRARPGQQYVLDAVGSAHLSVIIWNLDRPRVMSATLLAFLQAGCGHIKLMSNRWPREALDQQHCMYV